MRILMVCLGNICRSPMAEGIMRHKIEAYGLDWTVDSAGTEMYHIGEPPHEFSQNICRRHGIDISGQKARHFMASDFRNFDKIYAMAQDVLDEINRTEGPGNDPDKVMLFLEELNPGTHASVPDPWYGDSDGYKAVYEMIEKTCDAIIEKYAPREGLNIKYAEQKSAQ